MLDSDDHLKDTTRIIALNLETNWTLVEQKISPIRELLRKTENIRKSSEENQKEEVAVAKGDLRQSSNCGSYSQENDILRQQSSEGSDEQAIVDIGKFLDCNK